MKLKVKRHPTSLKLPASVNLRRTSRRARKSKMSFDKLMMVSEIEPQIKIQKFRLSSLDDTQKLAQKIAKTLKGGEVLALTGPLGSGKTTFVQYLARALGVTKNVRSPSFIILQTFTIKSKFKRQKAKVQIKSKKLQRTTLTLCHVDAYRLNDLSEIEALGLYDYLGKPDTVTVIEWAEKMHSVLPRHALWISITMLRDDQRQFLFGMKTLRREKHGTNKNA